MIGLYVVLAAVAVALGFGGYRRLTDGKAAKAKRSDAALDKASVGADPGRTTFLQFSATVCAPCRTTHRLLSSYVADRADLDHVEINAEDRLDLVQKYGITRTPTVLVIAPDGEVLHRIAGVPRREELDRLVPVPADAID